MKRMMIGVMIVMVVCMTACGGEGRYFGYREGDFEARIAGSIGGVRFEAEVRQEGGERSIRYLSPKGLEGVTVCVDETGEARVLMEEIEGEVDRETVEGLLEPLMLLTAYEGGVRSVQKSGGDTRVEREDGAELILGADGMPTSVKTERTSFAILSWESKEQIK